MSGGAATARRGVGFHLTHLLLLGGFSALIFYVTRVVPETQGSLWTIAAIGFLLLAGTLLSELLAPIGLPHLTGYLIAGIASGPYALKLVDEHTVKNLSMVNSLALSLIALGGGAELD
ncbi:MAG TPA: sodium:proton exchanger, partial [Polyangiaceae bacterium]|nr:sodium:proton exchanger [Polyangiaceae bacterium]